MKNVVLSLPGLTELWQETLGDEGICVVMLDGPVDIDHRCFKGARLKKALPISLRNTAKQVSSTHGTHVASVILGQHEGPVNGIAPNCRGVSIPVYGEDDKGELIPCCQMDLARAISQALQEGAHLINISGGELTPTGEAQSFLANAVRQCVDQNVMIIAATGNEGRQCLHVPATLPSVLAVGAANADGLPMEFSNWGEPMASQGILAPGENISGAVPNNGVTLKTGTSFATPIVTGVAALLLSLQKQKGEKPNSQAVREALLESAIPPGTDEPGDSRRMLAGRLNIPGAYSRLFQKPLPGSARMVRQPEKYYHNLNREEVNMSDETTQFNTKPSQVAEREKVNISNETTQVPTQVDTKPSQVDAAQHTFRPQDTEAQQLAPQVQASTVVSDVPSFHSGVSSGTNVQAAAQPPIAITAGGRPDCGCHPSQATSGMQPFDSLHGFITSNNSKLVYSVAEVGFDFGTEARKDYFTQQFQAIRDEIESKSPVGEELKKYFDVDGVGSIVEHNFKAFAKYLVPSGQDISKFPLAMAYLADKPADSNAVIWTLNIDATPVYAIRPINQFAIAIYRQLAEFLYDAAVHDADHVSVAGHIIGDIKLYNGEVVPVVDPTLRGMFNWRTDLLCDKLMGPPPPDKDKQKKEIFEGEFEKKRREITNFLNRIYYQLRNLGLSPQERAMNYFATNAFQINEVYEDVLKEAKDKNQDMVLDTIHVEASPISRPGSECFDVVLQFFNPLKRIEQARKVYRQTVDVSDIVPVTVGVMREWYIY